MVVGMFGHRSTTAFSDNATRSALPLNEDRASRELNDGRLPSFDLAVSNLQLWCILNLCMSSVDLH